MSKRFGRRMNDGSVTGLKQDRFRNSSFEYQENHNEDYHKGTDHKTLNTLGGVFNENRGRRAADERYNQEDNPFENGPVENWGHRKGWDRYYDAKYDRDGSRNHGGALIGHDASHRGKGPRGYSRSDESIYEDVCETLSLSPDVDASSIEVSVKEGTVFLNGSVTDRDSKRMAEREIEGISGVHDVQNLLSFKRDQSSPEDIVRN